MIKIADERDLAEFKESKRIKREPIRWQATGGASAECKPRTVAAFNALRESLRGVSDWGRASEQIDSIEFALKARHGSAIPKPNRVIQNEDVSISLFWDGLMIRCFPDGIVSIIGGANGIPASGINTDLLDLLGAIPRLK